jgi:hypothetical protein
LLHGLNIFVLTLLEVKQIILCNLNYALLNKLRIAVPLLGGLFGYNLLYYFVGLYSNSGKEAFKVAQAQGEERVVVLPDKKLAPQGGNPERPELSSNRINNIKEGRMAQAKTRTINQRTRTVVPVKGVKAATLMVIFDIQSKRTAHAIVKNGYYVGCSIFRR